MDNLMMEAMAKRIAALEAQVVVLEKRLSERGGVETCELMESYHREMNKTEAAEELGVTRATVYAMINDGRLKVNGMGRVLAKSVADLMYNRVVKPDKRRRGNSQALRMGADNQ